MEGLIPLVYKAIVEYKNGMSESPSTCYIKLRGDSGRYETSDLQIFADTMFSTTSSSPSARMVSSGVQSPASRCHHRISSRVMK
ncbi:hypothetical protein EJD97_002684 [Solanum chilense]|uniref:Uncharacterized protein n=1 Tax=Solanum chilense TaxID=4083 RepID=A0A6N2ANS4_SOLCI|nr:hypothetical protein EJD97_002684 [Solanum chilense]